MLVLIFLKLTSDKTVTGKKKKMTVFTFRALP